MKDGHDVLDNGLLALKDEGAMQSTSKTQLILSMAVECIGQGKLGVDKLLLPMPTYPGILGIGIMPEMPAEHFLPD